MSTRTCFAFQQLLKCRHALKQSYHHPNRHASNLSEIKPHDLKKQGIEAVVLDFDGVLAGHGENQPRETIEAILDQWREYFKPGAIFVLSNLVYSERINYLKQHHPDIIMITDVKKKPYPDGLEKIIKQYHFKPQSLIMIDDRLSTGILAGHLAGTQTLLITKPLYNKKHWALECCFHLLRCIERAIAMIPSKPQN